jgi:hypothetical protein
MSTKTKQVKKQEVIIKAPKITSAWLKVVEVSNKSEADITNAILSLYSAISSSKLSRNDARKVCKETNKEGSILKFSHIEGLDTWFEMRNKFAEFSALPIASQLSQATAAYKLLGVGNAEKMPSLEVVKKETATARKAKNSKGKGKTSTPTPKKTATITEALENCRNLVNALDPAKLTEKERDILADISVRLIELEDYAIAE